MKKRALLVCILTLVSVCFSTYAQDTIVGVASYYGNSMHGRKTASGERYNKDDYTCAHLHFKFGTKLLVRHLDTGQEVVVRVTDRGPYSKRFTIDLSYAAARDLGIIRAGHARVAIIPYDEKKQRTVILPTFPDFLQFHDTTTIFPHYEWRDTTAIKPKPLPITVVEKKK